MNEKTNRKIRKRTIILGIIGAILICGSVVIGKYLYDNMHYDEVLMQKVSQAGFKDKQETLPDGSVISYGEGPDNGEPLLLIHGQTVAWKDYDKVLPELSKDFHVYAVDCYGHGSSSHELDLYSCEANGEALIWFIDNIIKENCYLSGHSSGGILAAWIAANRPEKINGLVLEDPPFFQVTPDEIQEGAGSFAWYDGYIIAHGFVNQEGETDFPIYYLRNSYLLNLFGGAQGKIVESAVQYRQNNPELPIQIIWVPHAWLRPLLYMDNYDPQFGETFYNGLWMKGIEQKSILENITCPVIYLKADTQYGKDGVLYAANTENDANKVQELIVNVERINIKSGHNIHFEHPETFINACKKLLEINIYL